MMITTGTDKHRFDVVFEGTWYIQGSFSDHIKRNVPSGMTLLFDRMWRERLVPLADIHTPANPLSWPKLPSHYLEKRQNKR